jgi:hypothetical protein
MTANVVVVKRYFLLPETNSTKVFSYFFNLFTVPNLFPLLHERVDHQPNNESPYSLQR